MKKLFIIIGLTILLVGCTSKRNIIYEDTLYITRKYIGDFDTLVVEKRIAHIYTSQAVFNILGGTSLNIEKGAKCYLRYIPERLVGSHSKVYILYFTWDGTEDLFVLRQNIYTGEIY